MPNKEQTGVFLPTCHQNIKTMELQHELLRKWGQINPLPLFFDRKVPIKTYIIFILTFINREQQGFSIFNIILLSLFLGTTDDNILAIFWVSLNNDLMFAASRFHCEAPYLIKETRQWVSSVQSWMWVSFRIYLHYMIRTTYFCGIIISHLLFLGIEPHTLGNHRLTSTTPDIEWHLESRAVDERHRR